MPTVHRPCHWLFVVCQFCQSTLSSRTIHCARTFLQAYIISRRRYYPNQHAGDPLKLRCGRMIRQQKREQEREEEGERVEKG